VDTSPQNIARLRRALRSLPDQAINELADSDLDRYVVVRVADEIVVDLMKAACGIQHDEASRFVESVVIEDVTIPFASARLLWRTKDTMRDKDRMDRAFLASLLAPDERQ
jgi:cytochrome P450